MRKIHDVLRLKWVAELSNREIAQATGIARSTVNDYLRRAEEADLSWPLPEGTDHDALEQRLFKIPPRPTASRALPHWKVVHKELRRNGVTLWLLWEEYCAENAGAACYSYTRFCELYSAWRQSVDVVMRQSHAPGEKLFVDYAGQTVPVVDRTTGQAKEAHLFVAVLGASNYTFAVPTEGEDLRSWIGAHEAAFRFFGGVPQIVVPDNLKAGVTKAHRYEPDVNPTYQDMAEHYGVAVIPTRTAAPRDKAKAENGVLVAERWILARLRNRTFFSMGELKEAIAELLGELNDRPFQKLPGCRRTAFEELDQPMLGPLPPRPYVFAEWRKRRAGLDYHVEVDGHYYSVPFEHAKKVFDVRVTASVVECFLGGRRVASHMRSPRRGHHTTVREHMPKAHQQYAEWTPERITAWAEQIGPATAELTRAIISARRHPQQGYRSCLGILRLSKAYGEPRLEAAAQRALAIGARSYKSVSSILKSGLDQQPLPGQASDEPIEHENIRGALYYINNQGKN
jgi:transposase